MFIGRAFHQIDEKGRIRIPAKFKDELGKIPVIMQAPGNVLRVYPASVAEKIFRKLSENIDFSDISRSDAQTFIAGNSEYAEEDKQGRTLLTQEHIEYAHLKKDIVIEGSIDHLVIFDKELWEERKRSADMSKAYAAINSSRSDSTAEKES